MGVPGLAIYTKKRYILRQRRNYGNSNISPYISRVIYYDWWVPPDC
jgi:hypothetical protein